jgi:hypothetical protein
VNQGKSSTESRPTGAFESHTFVLGLWGVRYQVKDVSRSVAFYTERLGFKLDQQHLPAFAQVSIGNLKLILSGPGACPWRIAKVTRNQGLPNLGRIAGMPDFLVLFMANSQNHAAIGVWYKPRQNLRELRSCRWRIRKVMLRLESGISPDSVSATGRKRNLRELQSLQAPAVFPPVPREFGGHYSNVGNR